MAIPLKGIKFLSILKMVNCSPDMDLFKNMTLNNESGVRSHKCDI